MIANAKLMNKLKAITKKTRAKVVPNANSKAIPSAIAAMIPTGTWRIRLKATLDRISVFGGIGRLLTIQNALPSSDSDTAGVYTIAMQNPTKPIATSSIIAPASSGILRN